MITEVLLSSSWARGRNAKVSLVCDGKEGYGGLDFSFGLNRLSKNVATGFVVFVFRLLLVPTVSFLASDRESTTSSVPAGKDGYCCTYFDCFGVVKLSKNRIMGFVAFIGLSGSPFFSLSSLLSVMARRDNFNMPPTSET